MRLVTFERDGDERIGAVVPDAHGRESIVDLAAVAPGLPRDMVAFLAAGQPALALARTAVGSAGSHERLPTSSVRLLPPVPRPGKIVCVGYNYVGHGAAGAVDLPEFPDIFAKTSNTIVGPGDAVLLPRVSDQIDYEAELAVVIGTTAYDVPESSALDHVAGYTLFNDVTARDYQARGSQFVLGKSFDTFGPLGPALVTADEVPDPQRLDVQMTVNGVTTQRASTADMIFTVPWLVSYLSQTMTLRPGDVVATGTPAKLPDAASRAQFLQPGDVMAVTISGLGTLTNVVARREASGG